MLCVAIVDHMKDHSITEVIVAGLFKRHIWTGQKAMAARDGFEARRPRLG